jgi:endonuclease/exonuclease/phosphatase family metal-dependent hydrolase
MDPAVNDERCALIIAQLIEINADIICLQECSPELSTHLAQRLGVHQHTDGGDTAVLTRLEVYGRAVIELKESSAAAMTILSPRGHLWDVTSAHFPWGANNEGLRLAQAYRIEDSIDADHDQGSRVTVLAGDLNCLPQSATMRYLTGLDPRDDGTSTLWVDAWDLCGTGDGSTVSPANPLAATTARMVGIMEPSMLPDRRIDYVMVRGWVYGNVGCPVAVEVWGADSGTKWPSDHYAVVADCWDPDNV